MNDRLTRRRPRAQALSVRVLRATLPFPPVLFHPALPQAPQAPQPHTWRGSQRGQQRAQCLQRAPRGPARGTATAASAATTAAAAVVVLPPTAVESI